MSQGVEHADGGPLRQLLADERRALERRVEAMGGEADVSGVELGRAYARVLDVLLLRSLPRELSEARAGFALAGVGGFGRGAVALGADLDVRLLTTDMAAAESVAEALLYPLWDARLSVGHQVVTSEDLLAASKDDLPTATSLLDWRFVAGDRALSDGLLSRAHRGIFALSELPKFLARLEAGVEERRERYGGSVYMLEPDIKNGYGALRDVDVAWWAMRARWNVDHFDDLVRLGVLVPRQLRAVTAARESLWRVRNLLHHRAGRRSDRLSFDAQEEIAPILGYEGPIGEAVEHMMSDYYRAARTISRFRDLIIGRATPAFKRHRPAARDVDRGVVLFDGKATISDQDLLHLEPAVAFRLLRAAVEHDVPLRSHVRNLLIDACGDNSWTELLRTQPEAAELFVELCCCPRETRLKRGTVMREMHDIGLLLAMVPEFAPLVGRVHHDTYHVYTVDVHSVAAVDRLGEIIRGDIAVDEQEGNSWAGSLAMRLASEITRPRVLFFATLLHDVGKAIGRREHSERGAEMARVILPRLGFAADEIDAVANLVLNHLAMYLIATRRDLDDPATYQEVAQLVGDTDSLRNLYLLTVADLSTTSPTSMTSWKARMLDELFIATDSWLRSEDAPSAEQRRREAISKALAHAVDADERDMLARYLDSMPERYPLVTPPDEVVAHARVVREQISAEQPASLALVPLLRHEAAQLCVVAPDRPGLLANIAAALSAARLHVHAAQIYSCTLGDARLAVDLFWVQRSGQSAAQNDHAAAVEPQLGRLRRDLRAVLEGEVDAAALVGARGKGRRKERGGPAVVTRVGVDNRASPDHTVVEVITRDRPGLLFALSHAIYSQGLSIAVAKIATEGTRVVDVFYVSEQSGEKIADGERADRLRQALVALIEGMDP